MRAARSRGARESRAQFPVKKMAWKGSDRGKKRPMRSREKPASVSGQWALPAVWMLPGQNRKYAGAVLPHRVSARIPKSDPAGKPESAAPNGEFMICRIPQPEGAAPSVPGRRRCRNIPAARGQRSENGKLFGEKPIAEPPLYAIINMESK